MQFEKNDSDSDLETESDKPVKGARIILAISFGLGIISVITTLLAVYFQFPSRFSVSYFSSGSFITFFEVILVFFATLSITIGARRMINGIRKGWGLLFFGSFTVFFFYIIHNIKYLKRYFYEYDSWHVKTLLFTAANFLVFFFFGFICIWLLSPAIRKFPSEKKIFSTLGITACVCLLFVATFLWRKYYLSFSD